MQQIYKKSVKRGAFRRLGMLFLCFLLCSAAAFARSGAVSITIKSNDISVIDALREVGKQSGLSVGFNESRLGDRPHINLSLDNASLETSLSEILKGTGYTYRKEGEYVVIVPEDKNAEKAAATGTRRIHGSVLDEEGEPLIGATVRVDGTSVGTITDAEGNFTIDAPARGVITVSYVGYASKKVKVGSADTYRISLAGDSQVLSDVVVTALGIKREQKALSYNVQQVSADDITTIKDANFVNSLNGKVAGVNINTSSSGIGGASRVVMRGAKSIEQSSNALYVIDGVPMYNFGGGGDTEFGSKGTTEAIADINPEDIESISVLTGAAAAALYGSNAANGAVVITTRKGHVGKLALTVSSGIEWLKPFKMPDFQNRYGTGSNGKEGNSTIYSWGRPLNAAARTGYTPDDFFQTGAVYSNAITLSTGTEKNQSFFSAAAVNSDGLVPNNRYNRYNFTFRNTTLFLDDRMQLDASASYILQNDRNMTNQGQYSNPLVPAYLFPRGDDFSVVKNFERWDDARKIPVQFWPQGEGDLRMQNPYWIAYRNLRENNKKRYMGTVGLSYQVLDWLNLRGRVRIDNTSNEYEAKLYASTSTTLTDGSTQGHYTVTNSSYSQTYADFLVNIDKRVADFSIFANIGTSYSRVTSKEFGYAGPIRDTGIPNLFNVFDLDNAKKRATQYGWHEVTESVFASAEIGWRSMLYLTLTGRNDWASQLVNSPQSSFFYPSVGLSAVINEMVQLPHWVGYLKVRGSYSSVGNPYPKFLTCPTYTYDATKQDWSSQTNYPIGKLYPERTDSWEVGVDAALFNDFRLGASFYYATTKNQTFDPRLPVSSGYDKLYVQTGSVRNYGVELMLAYSHDWGGLFWDTSFTFSANRNKIKELVHNYVHPETGKVYNIDRLELNTSDGRGFGKAKFILKEGGTLGDLYTHADLKRDINGNILVDDAGNVTAVDNAGDIKLGSVFPKANLAWNNNLRWKGINLGFLVTARLGGIVYSATQAYLDLYGVSETSAAARDAGGVLVNGRSLVDPQSFYGVVASQSGLPTYYTYSATNVRLQEASIGYTVPRRWLGGVCDVTLSVVGKNLWMIYCKAPFDPEAVATTGNYYQGIDYFMMPSTRNIGFNIKVNF
ncbi:TonB-dependent receptor [uncultured Muribaculum sp.]|uniref:TonB-dependent receptor n=1 Tax=uncultured Muribaculum sp. TaxID=1918613 RepID=UPI0025FC75E6|nr:TonB-dependent receptor [uncultured Muribaculum sp.]